MCYLWYQANSPRLNGQWIGRYLSRYTSKAYYHSSYSHAQAYKHSRRKIQKAHGSN